MKRLIIFGTGAFAEISHYYFTTDSDYTVAGFTVDGQYVRETTYRGLPVVAFEEVERHFPPAAFDIFVAAGIRDLNRFRARKVQEAEKKGYRLASFLSSRATTGSDLVLAPNSMVMERAVLMPFVTIGRNTIVWPSTNVAMSNRIGSHCWLVTILTGESVAIGDYSFIGLGTVIAPSVSIGRSSLIGAGALILEDTKEDAVYKGAGSKPSRVPSGRAARLLQ